jgi:hypothetical protein
MGFGGAQSAVDQGSQREGVMDSIAEYRGNLLNHLEALYRPGDRELAVELATAMGCAVTDTGFASDAGSTFLAIHPNPDDCNPQNNAFYLSEATEEQMRLETLLKAAVDEDSGLQDALAGYRDKVRSRPFGVPHFGLRYRKAKDIEAAERRLAEASPALKARIQVRVFRPEHEGAATDIIQAFIHQDVIVSGAFLLGQLIEMQCQGA